MGRPCVVATTYNDKHSKEALEVFRDIALFVLIMGVCNDDAPTDGNNRIWR